MSIRASHANLVGRQKLLQRLAPLPFGSPQLGRSAVGQQEAGFWSMTAFLAILTIGFIYEWKKGALEWD